MNDKRLNSLSILSIESEIKVEINEVLKTFCNSKNRKIKLVLGETSDVNIINSNN